MALPKQNRLRSSRDFGKVYRKGKRASTHHLAVRALKQLAAQTQDNCPQALVPQDLVENSRTKSKQSADEQSAGEQSAGEKSPALSSCFGISISKKVSKRAVVRNRIKRQLRAIIRDRLSSISPGWQIVIIVRPSAVECEFADFLRELEYLLKKLNVLSKAKT